MPAKVVDASVLGALIFGEPRAEEALSLLKGAELYAPPLLAYELASVARKKVLKYPPPHLQRAAGSSSKIKIQAASYSPGARRPQYHRRWRA